MPSQVRVQSTSESGKVISPFAGELAPKELLIDLARLEVTLTRWLAH